MGIKNAPFRGHSCSLSSVLSVVDQYLDELLYFLGNQDGNTLVLLRTDGGVRYVQETSCAGESALDPRLQAELVSPESLPLVPFGDAECRLDFIFGHVYDTHGMSVMTRDGLAVSDLPFVEVLSVSRDAHSVRDVVCQDEFQSLAFSADKVCPKPRMFGAPPSRISFTVQIYSLDVQRILLRVFRGAFYRKN